MMLEGKSVVITGAGSGVGRASSLVFAREGARVVCADVMEGRVSLEAAREDYGVVLIAEGDDCRVDESATARLRDELRAKRNGSLPVIDRGEGYEKMLRGECVPRMR